jgi:hypothetical protein
VESDPWTVKAFQQQRSATWKAIRLLIFLLVLGILGFQIPFWLNKEKVHSKHTAARVRYELSSDDMTEGQFTLSLVSLVVAGSAIVAIVYAVRRNYRCPKCNEIPMGSWADLGPSKFGVSLGVQLFPTICPNCGARLI